MSEANYQYLAHIFSPLTNNCCFLISRRRRMAVERVPWPSLCKESTGLGDRSEYCLHDIATDRSTAPGHMYIYMDLHYPCLFSPLKIKSLYSTTTNTCTLIKMNCCRSQTYGNEKVLFSKRIYPLLYDASCYSFYAKSCGNHCSLLAINISAD